MTLKASCPNPPPFQRSKRGGKIHRRVVLWGKIGWGKLHKRNTRTQHLVAACEEERHVLVVFGRVFVRRGEGVGDVIFVQLPDLQRVVHSTRHNLSALQIKVLQRSHQKAQNLSQRVCNYSARSRRQNNGRGRLSRCVVFCSAAALQAGNTRDETLTALSTSSRCPSTPPSIATHTSVFRFHSRKLWSETNSRLQSLSVQDVRGEIFTLGK